MAEDDKLLKTKILEELQKQELLRDELLKELRPQSKPSGFFNHPAILLVLGFLLTSGAGAFITSCWQQTQWEQQQLVLARQRALDQKYELANEVAKAVGEHHAAISGVLFAITHTRDDEVLCRELPTRLSAWHEANRIWLINSSTLLQKLTVHFPHNSGEPIPTAATPSIEATPLPAAGNDVPTDSQSVRALFELIINERKIINNSLVNLTEVLKTNGCNRDALVKKDDPESSVSKIADKEVKLLNESKDKDVRLLMDELAKRILLESNPRVSCGFLFPVEEASRKTYRLQCGA